MFSDVLLTVDFDRTLTGPDSKIPQRNLDAVAWFMENGGSFTVNTGRSVSSFGKHLGNLTVNAPVLMYNGSARWQGGKLEEMKLLELDLWDTIKTVRTEFPEMNLEIQGADYHYLIDPEPGFVNFYNALKWKYRIPGKQRLPPCLSVVRRSWPPLMLPRQGSRLSGGIRWLYTGQRPGSLMSMPRASPKLPPRGSCRRNWGKRSWSA